MKKMNTSQGILGLGHLAKLNTDNATKAKIDEISKDGIRFLIESFRKP
jgi:hypothetical protein